MSGQPVEFPSFIAAAVDGMALFRSYGEWSIQAAHQVIEFIKTREAARANTTRSAVVALELHLFVPDVDDAITYKCVDEAQGRQQRGVLKALKDGPYAWQVHSTPLVQVGGGKVKAVGEDIRFATTCRDLLSKQHPPYGASIHSVQLDAMYYVTSDSDHVTALNSDRRACLIQLSRCVELSKWSEKHPTRGAMLQRNDPAMTIESGQPRRPLNVRSKSSGKPRAQPGTTVWVGGIPAGMASGDVERRLSQFGKVAHVALKSNAGRPQFAFVSYETKGAADRALSQARIDTLVIRPVAVPARQVEAVAAVPHLVVSRNGADVENLVQTFGCSRRQAQEALTKAKNCVATAGSYIAADLYGEVSDEDADDDAVVFDDTAPSAGPAPAAAPTPVRNVPAAEALDDAAAPPILAGVANLMGLFNCSLQDAQDALVASRGDVKRAGQLLGEKFFGDSPPPAPAPAPVPAPASAPAAAPALPPAPVSDAHRLAEMFHVSLERAREALRASHGNLHAAADVILGA